MDDKGLPMDPLAFFSRKQRFSLNVLTICDHNKLITYCDPSHTGTEHDSAIFKKSPIYNQMEEGGCFGAGLAADSAFQKSNFLKKTFNHSFNTNKWPKHVMHYNECEIEARGLIERTFGALKKKFTVLNHIKLGLENSQNVIMACVVIYNYSVLNSPYYKPVTPADLQVYEEETAGIENECGPLLQDRIMQFFGKFLILNAKYFFFILKLNLIFVHFLYSQKKQIHHLGPSQSLNNAKKP